MKTQARLRLRQAGKHHTTGADVRYSQWHRLGLWNNMRRAFEMNCAPKHSTEKRQMPYNTMDYVTGKTTWHGIAHIDGAENAVSYRWKPTPLPPVRRPHRGHDHSRLQAETK